MRQATNVSRDDLVTLGTYFGKFTKSKKFHLKITCLDILSLHAKVGVFSYFHDFSVDFLTTFFSVLSCSIKCG
jgi:UPF0113 Pre-PUA domain